MTLADMVDRETRRTFKRPALDPHVKRPARVERIIQEVTTLFSIRREDLLSVSRARPVSNARRMVCWRLYRELSLSSSQIGFYLRLHHTSIVHHLTQVRKHAGPIVPLNLDAPDFSGEWAI